jgi:hypothetical protein
MNADDSRRQKKEGAMRAHQALFVVIVAAVTLSSAAAAVPDTAKQRVAFTWKGVATGAYPSVDKFVLTPLGPGRLEPDSGTESTLWSNRRVLREGQSIQIETGVTTAKGKRGTFVYRMRTEWADAGNGYSSGAGTWKIVRGTGQYAGATGSGRSGHVFRQRGSLFFGKAEGSITLP